MATYFSGAEGFPVDDSLITSTFRSSAHMTITNIKKLLGQLSADDPNGAWGQILRDGVREEGDQIIMNDHFYGDAPIYLPRFSEGVYDVTDLFGEIVEG